MMKKSLVHVLMYMVIMNDNLQFTVQSFSSTRLL